ncbi:MAG TPA: GNAT family N-acetyltransferase [Clostridia bacterium]|nr:GNAT family N-acetyltransferase [Clostridia bacterium]
MKQLETERLILRAFRAEDFAAVHAYASTVKNTVFMPFGPNSEEETRDFIERAIARSLEEPCRHYEFAVTLRDTGALIGGCSIRLTSGSQAEVGWILHRGHWRKGYGTELGRALLAFGFDELGLHRVAARCDAENAASYGVMEKLGMRREGVFLEAHRANKLSDQQYGDELVYAMLKDEWDARKEMTVYNALPCAFDGFIDVPLLESGEVRLVCTKKSPAEPEKKYVPNYHFAVCRGSEKIGAINLRVGYADGLYYGGQIGYEIDEAYRGRGYAVAACRLLVPVAKAHGMTKLLVTNNVENAASRRVCEKLGARLVRRARVPEWSDLYRKGIRFVNIFELNVD